MKKKVKPVKLFSIQNRKTKLFLTKKKLETSNTIEVRHIESLIDDGNTYKIFGLGDELLKEVKRLYSEKKIHLGLRTRVITFQLLESLPIIQFNNIEVYTTNDTQSYDFVYNNFLGLNKEILEYPDIDVVDIKDYTPDMLGVFDKVGGELSLDYETFGFPTDKNFFPIGVGIYSEELNLSRYFAFNDVYDNIKNCPFFKDYKEFVKKNSYRLWVYNSPFEIGVDYRLFQEFHEYQDVYPLVIMDGRKGSLKLNGQYYLRIKSWDNEVDKIQKYLDNQFKIYSSGEIFLSKFKDSKYFTSSYIEDAKLSKQKKGIKESEALLYGTEMPNILKELLEYDKDFEDRLVKFWGNSWAITPYKLMGYYCCLDCFVTLQLMKKIKPLYSKTCYTIYLYNIYLKAVSNITGQININWNLKNEVESYYKKIYFNSSLYLSLMLYDIQKTYFYEKYKEVFLDKIIIPYGILYTMYEYGSFFFYQKKKLHG